MKPVFHSVDQHPEAHPEDWHFTPKMRGQDSLRGAAQHPEDEAENLRGKLRGNGGNPPFFGGIGRSYARAHTRAHPFRVGFSGVGGSGPRNGPANSTPKIGALASLRPNFGVRGVTA